MRRRALAEATTTRFVRGFSTLVLCLVGCSTRTFIIDDRPNRKVDGSVPAEAPMEAGVGLNTPHELPDDLSPSEITYYQHAKAILDARCVPCHAQAGFGSFALETYAQARIAKMAIHDAVADETMPPFPADDSQCQKLLDVRNMPAGERAVLEVWALAGAVEGDADQGSLFEVPAIPDGLEAPSDTISLGQAYVAPRSDLPVHRCFVLDPMLNGYTSLTSLGVAPSSARGFRRALVHMALPGSELSLALLEAEDTVPGYDCYYGGRYEGAITLSDTLVGASRFAFPDQTAVTVPPGTRFVLELETLPDTGPQMPALMLWRAEQIMERAPSTFFVVNTSFVIPRGEAAFSAQASGDFVARDAVPKAGEARAGTLWGVAAHMHLRGKSARIELARADGSRECLLSLPSFSTAWSGGYRFVEPVLAEAGDRLVVRCTWDNSAEKQPIVDGRALAPRDLTIGASVLDETCVGSVLMVED